jgi:molybdenum cofactor biosynthesis enzyme MoaA
MKQLPLFKDTEIFNLSYRENIEEIIKTNPYLGPKSEHMGYKKYIASKEWKRKAKFARQLAGQRCENCNKKTRLDVHHSNYKCLYRERFDDVYVLCRTCHKDEEQNLKFFAGYERYMQNKYGERWRQYRNEDTLDEYEVWVEENEHYEIDWRF